MRKIVRKLKVRAETVRVIRSLDHQQLMRAPIRGAASAEAILVAFGNDTNSGGAMCLAQ